jgi:hypothetical protein
MTSRLPIQRITPKMWKTSTQLYGTISPQRNSGFYGLTLSIR